MSMTDCLAVTDGIADAERDAVLDALDARLAAGDSPETAQDKAVEIALSELLRQRADMIDLINRQHPGLIAVDAEPPTADEAPAEQRQAGRIFTPKEEWTEEAFEGPQRSERGDTRGAMIQAIGARNRTLRRVNAASIQEADIARAAKALDYVRGEIEAGRFDQTEVPVGPMPHVLHMLGAPMQMLQMNASIVRKVLVDKHSDDFANVTPRELIEAIYKPAMVTQARAADEWEITTDLRAKNGNPITVVVKTNTELPKLDARTPAIKAASIMSAYARQAVGGKDSLLQRLLLGKVRYAEMERAHKAVNDQWAQFHRTLAKGLQDRIIKDDLALVKFIGDNYKKANPDKPWDDAPAFSRRGDEPFDLMASDFGDIDQTETDEFKRWFGDSKVVDAEGEPLVMYHGSGYDIVAFRPGVAGATFVTKTPAFADAFAMRGMGTTQSEYDESMEVDGLAPNVMPVYVSAKNPFDYESAGHVAAVKRKVGTTGDPFYDSPLDAIADGDYGAIESERVQAAIRSLGHDGFYVSEDGQKNLGVYNPSQIKSAIGNVGFFDPENPDIRYSRRNRPGRFKLRNFNIGHEVVESIQNRYNRWQQAIEDITEQGGQVTEASDFYRAEERYWGIVGARIEDFGEDVRKFVEAVADDKLMLDDVALYAYAQHAEERNDWIAGQRASMPDGGSGMLSQDARDILDEARQAGIEPELQRHAATLRAWIQGTRDLLFNEGLIDQDEYDAWTFMFQNYVPLRGLDGAPEARGTGQGFNIRGREGKAAMGRKSQARQIIEQIVQDRTRALTRAGKNDVLRSFAQFVLDNPSPNLWEINAVETKPVTTVDANGNRIIDEKQVIISDDRTVTVKDGGKEVHILVNDERLLEQLKNLNAENPNRIVGAFLFVNRVLAKLYTALNPVFTVINGARDVQAATVGIIDEIGFMAVPKLYANLPKSLYEAYRAEAGAYSPDYTAYRNTGGKTGFFDFKTLNAQTDELQRLLADAERSPVDPRKFGPKAMALVEALNAGIENAVRLAAFKTARQSGKTLAEAAGISKNITVNFNRRGTMTPTLSAYFLFFNPAVQGTTRIMQAMTSPKVLATLGAAMLGVAGLALRNAGMGEDDDGVAWWDKVPDEVKERNIVIMLPPGAASGERVPGSQIGRYVKVPMPYGYNFFAVVANQVVDAWRHSQDPRRGRDALGGAAKAFSAFMGAWIPVQELSRSIGPGGDMESLALLAAPDALNPIMQIAVNKSNFGRELRPEDARSKNAPDSGKYFPGQAGTIFQRAAEAGNAATGGDAYRSGLFDVAPSTLETVARGYGGGPASFTLDLINGFYLRQSISRDQPRYEALPFAKQLYGVIDAETDRMMGYQRLEEASKIVDPLQRAMDDGDGKAARSMVAEFGPMIALGSTIEQTREQLSELRKLELAIIAADGGEATKYARLQTVAEKRRRVLQQFNVAYDRAIVAQDAKQPPAAGR